ncbi:MAG TPA: hypothetical protein VKD22_04490, partial [Ramlibacter sp.]|nr:hypothetical protein [Ramlibacter sp.]
MSDDAPQSDPETAKVANAFVGTRLLKAKTATRKPAPAARAAAKPRDVQADFATASGASSHVGAPAPHMAPHMHYAARPHAEAAAPKPKSVGAAMENLHPNWATRLVDGMCRGEAGPLSTPALRHALELRGFLPGDGPVTTVTAERLPAIFGEIRTMALNMQGTMWRASEDYTESRIRTAFARTALIAIGDFLRMPEGALSARMYVGAIFLHAWADWAMFVQHAQTGDIPQVSVHMDRDSEYARKFDLRVLMLDALVRV